MTSWLITEWFDGFRYCAEFRGCVFQAATRDAAFAEAYAAKCLAAGI